MKILIAIVVFCVLANPVHAEMITFSIDRSILEDFPAPPQPLQLVVVDNFIVENRGVIASFTIDEIHSDDLSHILDENISPLRRNWTITESNASEYGLDWSAFENAINGRGKDVRVAFGPSQAIFLDGVPDGFWISGFQMERIELSLRYLFWHPIFPTLRAISYDGRIIGQGDIVPEPMTICLFACVAPIWVARRSR